MRPLDELWYFQLKVWGAAVAGNILDFTAMLCEEPLSQVVHRWQDRTRKELDGQTLNDGPVPQSWALPAVTELRLREAKAAA